MAEDHGSAKSANRPSYRSEMAEAVEGCEGLCQGRPDRRAQATAVPAASPAHNRSPTPEARHPQPDTLERSTMQKMSLDALAREHLERAQQAGTGRSSETVYGGHEHTLRQTVVALVAGTTLAEHENPGEATVHVLSGRVRLGAGEDSWEGRDGDLIIIPPSRHDLHAIKDSVVLLTVAKLR